MKNGDRGYFAAIRAAELARNRDFREAGGLSEKTMPQQTSVVSLKFVEELVENRSGLQPCILCCIRTWGCAPGWYRTGLRP